MAALDVLCMATCCLQHQMREINRSGTYYATARGFYIWCFAARVTVDSFEHSDYFYR